MQHNTFSLQNILNEPLDPNLCKRILQEIKSPLMQQSFAMTNDESLSQSWINQPKRPNIPPPSQHNVQQSRRPAIKSKFSSYGNGFNNNNCQQSQSFYDYGHNNQSYRNAQNQYHNNNNKSSPYAENNNFLRGITQRYDSQVIEFNKNTFDINNPNGFLSNQKVINNTIYNNVNRVQSIVSPLDPNITMRKQQQRKHNYGFDIWSQLCGGLFNTGKQMQNQLMCEDEGRSKFQRKKIFDSKGQSLLVNTKQLNSNNNKLKTNNHRKLQSILLIKQQSHIQVQQQHTLSSVAQIKQKPLKQVVLELRQNHHEQMAQFLQLICVMSELLSKAQKQRIFLLENMQTLYQLSTTQENDLMGLIISEQRYGKFLQRMNFSSLTDMIRKLSKKKLMSENKIDVKEYQRLKNKVSESLQNMLLNFSQVEKMVEQFMKQTKSIQKLKKVYHTIMQQSFYDQQTTRNTLQILILVINDVRLFKYESEMHQLEYVWDQLSQKVLTEQEFINGFVRGNGVYTKRQEFNESILADSRSRLQSELSKMGFIKN